MNDFMVSAKHQFELFCSGSPAVKFCVTPKVSQKMLRISDKVVTSSIHLKDGTEIHSKLACSIRSPEFKWVGTCFRSVRKDN